MARRYRRNSGSWRVLASSSTYRVWYVRHSLTIPASSKEEASRAAFDLVVNGEAAMAWVLSPSSLLEYQVGSNPMDAYGHQDPLREYIIESHGVDMTDYEMYPGAPMGYDGDLVGFTGLTRSEARAVMEPTVTAAKREFARARREETQLRALPEVERVMSTWILPALGGFRPSNSLVAIGRRYTLIQSGSTYVRDQEILMGLEMINSGWGPASFQTRERGQAYSCGLSVLPKAMAEALWLQKSERRFVDLKPTPGFE